MKPELSILAAASILFAGCATHPSSGTATYSPNITVDNSGLAASSGPDGVSSAMREASAPGIAPARENGADAAHANATIYNPAEAQVVVGDEASKDRTTANVIGTVGSIGAQEDQGGPRIVGSWTSYREYNFSYNDASVASADLDKTAGIASYMRDNPALQLGLDGSMDPNGTDPKNQELTDRRVEAVRTNLVDAGVPSSRINVGTFGDPASRRDRRVEVLFSTTN
jgi:outer membrane protein OmpA-like peptidoglycan-associated protein